MNLVARCQRMGSRYLRLLDERPLPTKMVSTGILMGFADMVQQYVEFRPTRDWTLIDDKGNSKALKFWHDVYDPKRTFRMVLFMSIAHVTFLHFYWRYLDRIVGKMDFQQLQWRGQSQVAVTVKVLLDQTVACPPYMVWMLFANAALEGKSWQEIKVHLEKNYWDFLLTAWSIWFPAHFITYNLSFRYRQMFVDVVRIYFGTRISYYANR